MARNRLRVLYHGDILVPRGGLIDPPVIDEAAGKSPLCHAPCFTYLIETEGGRKIIVDAAVSREYLAEWPKAYLDYATYEHTEGQRFAEMLKSHKLGPEDIDLVFLSHLHCDHAGNARLFTSTNATIMVHKKELEAAQAKGADIDFYVRADFDIASKRFTYIDQDVEIDKGIRAIQLPGHTAGTVGLLVETEHCGNLVITSDACYLKDSYDLERSEGRPADREQWLESMHRLKHVAKKHNATILPGHDHEICHEGRCPIAHEPRVRDHEHPYS